MKTMFMAVILAMLFACKTSPESTPVKEDGGTKVEDASKLEDTFKIEDVKK